MVGGSDGDVRPVPDSVLRCWPDVPVDMWRWCSPHRLIAERPIGSTLVVVRPDGLAQGMTVPPGTSEGEISSTYAGLMMSAWANDARATACREGVPVLADDGYCIRCQKAPAGHRDQLGS